MSNLLGLEEQKPSTGEYDNVTGPDPEWATKAKSGANWFYWIAGLSVINSAAFVFGANFHFLAGLGLTEIADAVISASIEQGAPSLIKAFSIIFDLILVIGFALAGYYANKFFTFAFIAGIVVYIFDALIVLLLGDYFMAGFHAFALFFIIRGFLACRHLKAHEAAIIWLPPPPPAL
jgi:hypothetical protein